MECKGTRAYIDVSQCAVKNELGQFWMPLGYMDVYLRHGLLVS